MKSFTLWIFITFGVLGLLTLTWLAGSRTAISPSAESSQDNTTAPVVETVSTPKKILFVHSYHQGYPWTDGILAGFVQALELSQKKEPEFWESTNILLQNFYMDSKRHATEESKQAAASQAKGLIESWKPDIIVTSDDNALKYLVVPILDLNTVPIIFCGVNWDASEYKLPASRVTGMIEVQPIDQILSTLQPYARGTKIGFLKGNDFSATKEADAFENFLGVSLQRRLVADFDEWLTAYRELQQESDILLVGNSASIAGWDALEAKQLVTTATQIPTGTWDAWMRDYALVTFSTVPEEQGTWLADTSRAILAGKPLNEVPVSRNQKAKIYRNMAIAKQLDIVFPMEFIRRSWAVEQARTQ